MIIPGQFVFILPSGFPQESSLFLFPTVSNFKLSPAVAAILNFILEQKENIQMPSSQKLQI
jgi:hypothetical protein